MQALSFCYQENSPKVVRPSGYVRVKRQRFRKKMHGSTLLQPPLLPFRALTSIPWVRAASVSVTLPPRKCGRHGFRC
jgi:hypothetical protein